MMNRVEQIPAWLNEGFFLLTQALPKHQNLLCQVTHRHMQTTLAGLVTASLEKTNKQTNSGMKKILAGLLESRRREEERAS